MVKEIEKVTICKTCGFPKEWERDLIILNDSVDSLMMVVNDDEYRCSECKYYKDGSTINKLKPLLKEYKEIGIRLIKDKFEKIINKMDFKYLDEMEFADGENFEVIVKDWLKKELGELK